MSRSNKKPREINEYMYGYFSRADLGREAEKIDFVTRGTLRSIEGNVFVRLLVWFWMLESERVRFQLIAGLDLDPSFLAYGNGGGSIIDVRSTMAMPSPFPVIAIRTSSLPSATSAS